MVVTCSRPNPILTESVQEWIDLARRGDHAAFMDSNLRRMYSDSYCRRNRWMIPVLGKLTKPKSYDRFLIQARACLGHNALDELPRIKADTLVIGGEKDLCLGPEASRVIADRISGAQLRMYEQWGHGLYEEEKDFNRVVQEFLK
jgi:pimeloyl-ACP methyl ester carboxylesterase